MHVPQLSPSRLRPRSGWSQRFLSDQLHPAIRAVIAAVIAWEMGLAFGPPQAAYFAVFTALAANYPTVARSVTQTLYYGASVLASILLVFAVDEITNSTVTALALAIGVAIIIGAAPISMGDVAGAWYSYVSCYRPELHGHDARRQRRRRQEHANDHERHRHLRVAPCPASDALGALSSAAP